MIIHQLYYSSLLIRKFTTFINSEKKCVDDNIVNYFQRIFSFIFIHIHSRFYQIYLCKYLNNKSHLFRLITDQNKKGSLL
jgi:hypothetical protein